MGDHTILVIDYDPRSQESIRNAFERTGHRVEVATDGARGIEAFRKLRPTLTLIEFMIPKKSGLEVCQELRQTPEGVNAMLVVMSSRFRSRHYRTEAKHKYRADAFVEKPLREDDLLGLLERARARSGVATELAIEGPRPAAGDQPAAAAEDAGEVSVPGSGDFESEVTDRLDSILGDL